MICLIKQVSQKLKNAGDESGLHQKEIRVPEDCCCDRL